MAESQRLFFALWPTEEQQRTWGEQARELIPAGDGRLIPAQNLHLTLLFLGEIATEVRDVLLAKVAMIHVEPFELMLEQIGYWRRPQVLWWGPRQTPEPLQRLVAALALQAQSCGLEVERRPYQAHMTLARKVRRSPGRPSLALYSWQINDFVLVESCLTSAGAEYRILQRWPLG
jgi:2'-5' RNA ligase